MLVGLLPMAVSAWALTRRAEASARTVQVADLSRQTETEARTLENYFAQARTNVLLLAQNPAFTDFYRSRDTRSATIAAGGARMTRINDALGYLEKLYPTSIGEACFIDSSGAENARVVRGERAPIDDLSPDETETTFFLPAIATKQGDVYQSTPYVSPDTKEWVLSNSTPVGLGGENQAIVHFEVTIESFRREAQSAAGNKRVQIVDVATGAVIIDSSITQEVDAPLGGSSQPVVVALPSGPEGGFRETADERSHTRALSTDASNQNKWAVVVSAPKQSVGLLGAVGLPMLMMAVLLVGLALLASRRWGHVTTALAEAGAAEERMRTETVTAEREARDEGARRVVTEYRGFAKQVANGDLTARVAVSGDSDLAPLALDMNAMVGNLGAMSGDVRDVAREIHRTADQIFGVVSDHTAETAQQAGALRETTAAVDLVRASAEKAAGQARTVAAQAEDALTVSDEGGRLVDEIMVIMREVQSTVVSIANEIAALSDETRAIQAITGTVNDIADQSNLLALNATIEAARAGEEGKGFAVVAEQVRNLAAQSKAATREVSDMLAHIERRTMNAVEATTVGRDSVESGVAQALEAGSAIQQLAATLRGTAEAAAGISIMVQEQFSGSDQIAEALHEVATSTSRISDGAELTRDAAATLRELANRLSQATDRYKLDRRAEHTPGETVAQ